MGIFNFKLIIIILVINILWNKSGNFDWYKNKLVLIFGKFYCTMFIFFSYLSIPFLKKTLIFANRLVVDLYPIKRH